MSACAHMFVHATCMQTHMHACTHACTHMLMLECPHALMRKTAFGCSVAKPMDGLSDGTVVLGVRKNTEQPNAVSHKSTLFHADEPAPQFLRHLPKI